VSKTSWGKAVLSLFVVLSSQPLTAQDPWVVGTDPTYAPFVSLSPAGEIVGVDIELMKAIAANQKAEVVVRNVPWDDLVPYLAAHKIDAVVSGLTVLDWRKTSMDFSTPYYAETQVVVVGPSLDAVKEFSDLQGATVGVLEGSRTAKALAEESQGLGLSVKTFTETQTMYEALKGGVLSAFFLDRHLAEQWKLNPKSRDVIRIAFSTDFVEDYAIAVAKGNQELLETVNRGLAGVRASGEWAAIISPLDP